jgi:hypothetical protein
MSNNIEDVIASKFEHFGKYEEFVLEYSSDFFYNPHNTENRGKHTLTPDGILGWITCRVIHKCEARQSDLALPDTYVPELPSAMWVAAMHPLFSSNLNPQIKEDDQLIRTGDLLLVSPVGNVTIPGYKDMVMVNIKSVFAVKDVGGVELWFMLRADKSAD